jgi:hypothetical protein
VAAPFGDYLLVSYEVDCQLASIRLVARSATSPPCETELVFAGVAAYQFESDAFRTVLGQVIEQPVGALVERLAERFRAGWAADGWPRFWGAHPSAADAGAHLASEGVRAFELTSAIGMHGWVLARSFETRARSPRS